MEMMMDPAMRHLSGTWMGAFYTSEINKTQKRPRKSVKSSPKLPE